MLTEKIIEEYNENLLTYRLVANNLAKIIESEISSLEGIHSFRWRIKSIESIKEKLEKTKKNSINDLQDIIGLRILVFDRKNISKVMERIYSIALFGDNLIGQNSWLGKGLLSPESSHQNFTVSNSGIQTNIEIEVRSLRGDAILTLEQEFQTKLESEIYKKIERLNQKVNQFEKIINSDGVREKQDIHNFLNLNNFIIHPIAKDILSEVQIGLGKQYQIDFLIQKSTGDYLLVELENSKHRLFNNNGDFSAAVNHAVKQVEDWQEWIEENILLTQKKYPGISSPEGLIIIGKSHSLNENEIRSLKRRNINTRGRLKIITYDELIINSRDYINSISANL